MADIFFESFRGQLSGEFQFVMQRREPNNLRSDTPLILEFINIIDLTYAIHRYIFFLSLHIGVRNIRAKRTRGIIRIYYSDN